MTINLSSRTSSYIRFPTLQDFVALLSRPSSPAEAGTALEPDMLCDFREQDSIIW